MAIPLKERRRSSAHSVQSNTVGFNFSICAWVGPSPASRTTGTPVIFTPQSVHMHSFSFETAISPASINPKFLETANSVNRQPPPLRRKTVSRYTLRTRNFRTPNSVSNSKTQKATPAKPKSLLHLDHCPARARTWTLLIQSRVKYCIISLHLVVKLRVRVVRCSTSPRLMQDFAGLN
jgi:hypothetical protein